MDTSTKEAFLNLGTNSQLVSKLLAQRRFKYVLLSVLQTPNTSVSFSLSSQVEHEPCLGKGGGGHGIHLQLAHLLPVVLKRQPERWLLNIYF